MGIFFFLSVPGFSETVLGQDTLLPVCKELLKLFFFFTSVFDFVVKKDSSGSCIENVEMCCLRDFCSCSECESPQFRRVASGRFCVFKPACVLTAASTFY